MTRLQNSTHSPTEYQGVTERLQNPEEYMRIFGKGRPPSVHDMKVYLIRCKLSGRVKIGIATKPVARLHNLQLMSPTELELICSCKGGRTYEREIHERFAAQRLHGEWFNLTREQVRSIAEEMNGHPTPSTEG